MREDWASQENAMGPEGKLRKKTLDMLKNRFSDLLKPLAFTTPNKQAMTELPFSA